MNYSNYSKSRDAAWQILVDYNVDRLPVKIVRICKSLGIRVKSYSSVGKDDGYCKMYPDAPFIFVNSMRSSQRQRFTIAHELGHIILGHIDEYKLMDKEPHSTDDEIEQEANVFASRILAPICVLHEIGVKTPEEIALLCNISLKSAKIRFQRLQQLEKREMEFIKKYGKGCFFLSPLEVQISKQFKSFIKDYKSSSTSGSASS